MAGEHLVTMDERADAVGSDDRPIESIDVLAAHQSGDHVLAMYVAAFNDVPGAAMAVTVFSGGYAFSGRMVGAPDYFEAVAALVDDEGISVPFRQMAEVYRGDDPDDEQLLTTYVHMLDVDVFGGAQHLATLAAWRGRLSQVSAWSTERITRPQPKPEREGKPRGEKAANGKTSKGKARER